LAVYYPGIYLVSLTIPLWLGANRTVDMAQPPACEEVENSGTSGFCYQDYWQIGILETAAN